MQQYNSVPDFGLQNMVYINPMTGKPQYTFLSPQQEHMLTNHQQHPTFALVNLAQSKADKIAAIKQAIAETEQKLREAQDPGMKFYYQHNLDCYKNMLNRTQEGTWFLI